VRCCQVLCFKRLGEALESPGEFLLSDFSKMERGALLHLAFQALDTYQVRPGCGRTAFVQAEVELKTSAAAAAAAPCLPDHDCVLGATSCWCIVPLYGQW
jgi:ubiquitin-activating enzyme E1